MKPFGIIILIFLCIPSFLYPQVAPKIEWQKCLGGSRDEDNDPLLQTIIQTKDGGYIIAGQTNSNDGDVSGYHGGYDAWVVKLNSSRSIEWQKCLGGSGTEDLNSIIQTSDKGYVVAGFTTSTDGDVSGIHGPDNHGQEPDGWIVKLDSSGKIQWQKCIGSTSEDVACSIIQCLDGGYVVTGYTSLGGDGDLTGNHGGFDGWIAKLNSSGNIEWVRCLGGSGADVLYSVIQTSDGGYAIGGATNSKDEGFLNHVDRFGNGTSDAWIVKLDSLGGFRWQKLLGGTGIDYAYSIIQTKDGGYAVAGETNSIDGDVSGNHGAYDAWVLSLDTAGSILWQKCLGGSIGDNALSIINTTDGGYAITGSTNSIDGDVSGKHGGVDTNDFWVVKLNSAGSIQWQKCLGGENNDEGFAIIQTKDGGYAISGRTYSNNGDVSGNHGEKFPIDIWVVKLSPEASTVVNDYSGQTFALWAYPDPSNDQVHLHLFQSQPLKQIQFYNLLGIQYYPDYLVANNILTVNGHNLPDGSYIVRVVYLNTPKDEIQKFLHYH